MAQITLPPTAIKKKNQFSMFRVDTTAEHESLKTTKPEFNVFWGQTEKIIKIDILISLPHDKIDVSYDATSLKFNFAELVYNLELKFANAICKDFFTYKVLADKVEIKLKKDLFRTSKRNMTWASLCKDGLDLEKGKVDDQLETSATSDTKTDSSGNILAKEPPQKVTHDWYQTDTQVIVEVRVKGLLEKEVEVTFGKQSLSLNAKLPYSKGREYQLELQLADEIVTEQSTYKIWPSKLEIRMQKEQSIRWKSLEMGEHPMETNTESAEGEEEGNPTEENKSKRKDVYKYWDSKESQGFMNREIWTAYRQSVDKENDMRSRDKFVQDSIQDYIGMYRDCPPGVNPRDMNGGNIPPRYW